MQKRPIFAAPCPNNNTPVVSRSVALRVPRPGEAEAASWRIWDGSCTSNAEEAAHVFESCHGAQQESVSQYVSVTSMSQGQGHRDVGSLQLCEEEDCPAAVKRSRAVR